MSRTFFLRPLAAASLALGLFHGSVHALTDAEFVPASQAFRATSSGGEGAIDAAAAAFSALQKAEPGHPVPLAYGGSLESMRARTTMLPWRKIGFAEDGMATIDKALMLLTPAHDAERLTGTPVTLLVKLTAANTFLAVPSFMNRGTRGRRLIGEVMAHPDFASCPAPFREAAGRLATQHPPARADDTRSVQ
jgi:hypothetical protein